ncbi:HipA family kinase [Klebsiella pneumoniae]|uniref:HipA family kinase n=1 Tax=Klebsiella pneumoniae TaxID=573 RepID=UPI001D0D9346|nr:HipA family kinase [Klebsiella pneumoniae]
MKSKPSMPPKNLVAEFVAGWASDIGLPIPDFKVVFVPEELIEYTPELKREISTGHAFASQYIDGAVA